MPLYKINKKFYSNNPPCSKKLRKLGSFLYMDHLFFKEGTKRLRYLKSFTSCHGKFIYTNTYMWWVHVTITEYLFFSFLPIPPHRSLKETLPMSAFSPNWLYPTFHKSKGHDIGLRGLLFQFLLTRSKQKSCLCQQRMQLNRMGNDVGMDAKIKMGLGQYFPVDEYASANLRAGWRNTITTTSKTPSWIGSSPLFNTVWYAIPF